jgi:hypothetical protein
MEGAEKPTTDPRISSGLSTVGDQVLVSRVRQGVEDSSRVTISHRSRSLDVMNSSPLPFGTAFTVEEH